MIEYAKDEFPHSVNLKQAIEEDKYVEVQYGFFIGGDPRDFNPDIECCSKEELERWNEAVELWNSGNKIEYDGSHFWIVDESGEVIGHGTKATFGIGTYLCIYDYDPHDQSLCEHHYQADFEDGTMCACCGFLKQPFETTAPARAVGWF